MGGPVLSGMTMAELQGVAEQLGLPRFAARQMAEWIYKKQIFEISEMTNLSKTARQRLSEEFVLGRSRPVREVKSADGTVKYLFRTLSGHYVETVYIPTADRATLCISTQVGCRMGCKFCMTGRQGLQAQLTVADMLNQIYSIPHFERLTNIVVMGQGEPFDNTDAVIRTCQLLTSSNGLAWSPKRITVSTVGLTEGMQRFLRETDCHLAISLHFPFAEERKEWMPAERAFPMDRTLALLRQQEFCREIGTDIRDEGEDSSHQRRLSFEYIVFQGLNDDEKHARALIRLLRGLRCRVNLIPFHTIPDSPFQGATEERMKSLRNHLTASGLLTTLRASRGQDIDAACGLLSTKESKA